MNISHVARRGYVKAPTPLEELPKLSRALGGKVNVLMKRDDCLPGAGGGNKTRKLDYVMQEAVDSGADCIITYASVQSNHCRLTIDWANREGMPCHLVLEERIPGSYHPRNAGNNFLYYLLGVASVTVVPGGRDMMQAAEDRAAELSAQGKKPFIVPVGASTSTGAMGYAACVSEIMGQLVDMRRSVDHIIVPSGSSGTQAGLVAGVVGMNLNVPVHGVCVGRSRDQQEAMVYDVAKEVGERLGVTGGIPRKSVICYDEYVGPGYSLPTDAMVEAVTLTARTEGILLDPTYTGKAMACLIDLVRKGTFPSGSTLLFLHTGGSLALYDKPQYFWDHIST